MPEKSEAKIGHPQTPFAEAVELLKSSIDDEEQFNFAVKLALARVTTYTDHTIIKGADMPASHERMLYEHGFTLFKRELPDNLTKPFAKNAAVDIEEKDDSKQPVYKETVAKAFKTIFETELADLAGSDQIEQEIGALLMEKPGDVIRPIDFADRIGKENTDSGEGIDSDYLEVQALYDEFVQVRDELLEAMLVRQEKAIKNQEGWSEAAENSIQVTDDDTVLDVLTEARDAMEGGNWRRVQEIEAQSAFGYNVKTHIKWALDEIIMRHAISAMESGDHANAKAWVKISSQGVQDNMQRALDVIIMKKAIEYMENGKYSKAREWVGVPDNSSTQIEICRALNAAIFKKVIAYAEDGDIAFARTWINVSSSSSAQTQMAQVLHDCYPSNS